MPRLRASFLIAGLSLSGLAAVATAQDTTKCAGSGMMPGMCMMMGGAHDTATMAQMQAIHQMVMNHDKIARTVTNLPNGVRTTTESSDPAIAQLIKDHVLAMAQRVEKGSDPNLPMESAALHAIFNGNAKIKTVTQITPAGAIVEQTSSDSAVAAALQQHAAELSDLVQRGMAAMHESMMKNMPGMKMPGMKMPAGQPKPATPPPL